MTPPDSISVRRIDARALPALSGMLAASTTGWEAGARLLEEKTIGDPDFEPDLLLGALAGEKLIGALLGVRRPWKAGRERQGWIKFIFVEEKSRRRGAGRLLVEEIERRLAARRVERVTFGSSAPSYFFPGVPRDDAALLALLESCGWRKSSERINLSADLPPPDDLQAMFLERSAGLPEVKVSRAAEGERDEIDAFLKRRFSHSWALEIAPAFTGAPGAVVSVVRAAEPAAGAIAGFSAVNCTNPGWLGPMGIVESRRKQGLGALVLLHSVLEARRGGSRRITIPWVNDDAERFYRRVLGARRHASFWKVEKVL